MTQIHSSQFQVQNYTSQENLQRTQQSNRSHGAHKSNDNVVHTETNDVNRLINDLDGAVNAAQQGSATAVLHFDGDIDTQEIYLRTDDQVLALSLDDAKVFLADLKALAAQPGFSFDYAKLNLALQESQVHVSSEGGVASAQEVLNNSNGNGDDKWWSFMNGGAQTLTKDDPAIGVDKVGPLKKPGSWYNGIAIRNGKPSVYTSPNSAIKAPYKMETMDELQSFIRLNMDTNGAFSELQAKAQEAGRPGQDLFIEAMGAQEDEFRSALLSEIYSYATQGTASDGSVDLGKLQAILRAYDPEMHTTASSNTDFDGPEFTIGGQTLNEGDGILGRATILEMRHIGVGIEVDESQTLEATINYDPPDIVNPEADVIIAFDVSGSMNNNQSKTKKYMDQTFAFSAALQQDAVDIDGSIRAMVFNSNAKDNGLGQQTIVDNDGLQVSEQDLNKIGNQLKQSDGYHHESSFVAASNALEQFGGPPGPDSRAREVVVLSDEPDHNPNKMKEMLEKADYYGATVRFINPENGLEITSDQLKEMFYVDGQFSEDKYLSFMFRTSSPPEGATMEHLEYALDNVDAPKGKSYLKINGDKIEGGRRLTRHEGVISFRWDYAGRQLGIY